MRRLATIVILEREFECLRKTGMRLSKVSRKQANPQDVEQSLFPVTTTGIRNTVKNFVQKS
jgi:hypothetical protein